MKSEPQYEYLIFKHDGSKYVIEPIGIVKTLEQAKQYIYSICGRAGKETMKWYQRPTECHSGGWHGDNSMHYYLANRDVNSPYFGNADEDYMKVPVTHKKILNRAKYFNSFGFEGSLY